MNIVIVDDHEEARYLLEAMLRGSGHDVRPAANGSEALDMLKVGGCDLIITDILMPVMDGFQLCRKVKADETLRHIPLIIYTATYTGPRDEEFAMKIGANRFIQKPCEPDVFMSSVADVMAMNGSHKGIADSVAVDEDEILSLYNERLVRNLEQKVLQTEREILRRKEVERSLRENEEKLRRITASAQDAIIMMDNEGKVSFWNEAAERIFGYSHHEIMGNDLHVILAPRRFHEKYDNAFPHFRESGQSSFIGKITELSGQKKDGTEFPIELALSGVKIKGKWHAIGLIRDITDRKRIEFEQKEFAKRMQQSQKMEAIGTLAGGIAHDFNNILSAIVGYTELAKFELIEDSLGLAYMDKILEASNRAKDLVQQILTFSRQQELELKPISVALVVKEALKLIRASLPSTIDIIQNIQSKSLVMGDPTQVHQIIMNLCTNAGHSMQDQGGMLKVEISDVELDSDFVTHFSNIQPGSYIRIKVEDSGQGMSSEVLNRIFEPFFTTKEQGEGTGLGLAVVHGIVEKLGGTISAYSEPGKGSSFKVFLPAIKTVPELIKEYEVAIPVGTERILFIDDELPLTEIGAQILKNLGYEVTCRTSPIEALELFQANPDRFDLVITDLTMPKMPGDKLARELISIRNDIPIILCTGFSYGLTKENYKQIGVRGILTKPILRSEIAEQVRNVLDEQK